MSIEKYLNEIYDNFISCLENYVTFPLDEIPKLIKKMEAGENITISRPNNEPNKFIKDKIYVSDLGFILKVISVVDTWETVNDTDSKPSLKTLSNFFTDTIDITLEPQTKLSLDDEMESKILKSELDNAKNIWVTADYHLIIYDKKGYYNNKKLNEMITKQNEYVNEDDVFIFLGDLVNGEITDQDVLRSELKKLRGKKILIKGNNDSLPDEFYKECGFISTVDILRYKNIIFSHPPLHKSQFNGAEYNIHGHIHGYRSYLVPYHNHIDGYCGLHENMPMRLNELFKKFDDGFYKPGFKK